MVNWQDFLVSANSTLRQAARTIDSCGGQIAVVVDNDRKLLGTLTDADLRKALLNGFDFERPCSEFMSSSPISLPFGSPRDDCKRVMQERHISQLPLIDADGVVRDVILLTELFLITRQPNPVVIMAGGLGTRLAELTHKVPKPMLKIGNRPLLETLILQLSKQGFYDFYISVNHKAEVITEYFGDGANWGVNITFLHERKRLGTAGALHMLPNSIKDDIVLINGDILSKIDVTRMLSFHRGAGAAATMAVKDYNISVPYGVVNIGENREILSISEKPTHRYFINAGIYSISANALKLIPKDQFFDTPTLFQCCETAGLKVCAYPLHEYWIDIGHISNFQQANYEFDENFSEI